MQNYIYKLNYCYKLLVFTYMRNKKFCIYYIITLEYSGLYIYVNTSKFRYTSLFWISICDKPWKQARVKVGVSFYINQSDSVSFARLLSTSVYSMLKCNVRKNNKRGENDETDGLFSKKFVFKKQLKRIINR